MPYVQAGHGVGGRRPQAPPPSPPRQQRSRGAGGYLYVSERSGLLSTAGANGVFLPKPTGGERPIGLLPRCIGSGADVVAPWPRRGSGPTTERSFGRLVTDPASRRSTAKASGRSLPELEGKLRRAFSLTWRRRTSMWTMGNWCSLLGRRFSLPRCSTSACARKLPPAGCCTMVAALSGLGSRGNPFSLGAAWPSPC